MKTSRIMAGLVLLGFTFAGISTVWADREIKIDNVKIKKETDQQGNVKIKKNDIVVLDNQITVVTTDNLVNLLNEKKADIDVVTKDNPTCYWYWDGSQWRKYCW